MSNNNTATAGWGDGKNYPVELGVSFNDDCGDGFHTIKYDFKPHSIDYETAGKLEVSQASSVGKKINVQMFNDQSETIAFAGSCQSVKYDTDCVLIFDKDRQVFTLERVSNAISLRHDRTDQKVAGQKRAVQANSSALKNKLGQIGKSKRKATATATRKASTDDSTSSTTAAPTTKRSKTSKPSKTKGNTKAHSVSSSVTSAAMAESSDEEPIDLKTKKAKKPQAKPKPRLPHSAKTDRKPMTTTNQKKSNVNPQSDVSSSSSSSSSDDN